MRFRGARDTGVGALLALALLSFNSGWVSARLGFVHRAKRVQETDHLHYLEMAKGREGRAELAQAPPYCYRILTPLLARALARTGIGPNGAFYLITNASLFGFLLALWRLLLELGFSPSTRAVGLVLVGLTQGPVRWFEYQYWMSDPPCLFLLTWALVLIRRDRLLALALVSVAAAFVRETYVLVYPCCLLAQWRRRGAASATVRTIAVAAIPIAIMAALRMAIVPNQPDDLASSIADSLSFRLRHLWDNQLYVLTVGTWGVLLPLAFLVWRRLPFALRNHTDLVALALMAYGTLVISNNTERPLAYAVPAVLSAALSGFDRLVQEGRLPWALMASTVVAVQAGHFVVTRFGELGMSIYQPSSVPVIVATGAFWLLALFALRLRTGSLFVTAAVRTDQ
jgi:hypothetical protein